MTRRTRGTTGKEAIGGAETLREAETQGRGDGGAQQAGGREK